MPPRKRANAAAAKPAEPVKPVEPEPEEKVELDESEDMEEEVEYEEVEEEVEEEEEVVEEGDDDEEEENADANGAGAEAASAGGDDTMKVDGTEESESEEHAKLLALPPHGSEVYVGGIPHDATEQDLRSFCESVGEVADVRVMKGRDSSENKGYAFVSFRTKELAEKAIDDLNNTEFKGKKIRCSTSQAKHRLFIGNLPRNWGEDDLKKTVTEIGPGVDKVDVVKDPNNAGRNRGFAFVEYYNHECADYSRKKMSSPKFKLEKNTPTVSWADPKNADSSISQVKSVYVKKLPNDVTQEQLRKLFEHHGEIVKVVLPPAKSGQDKRFGFVHFADRSAANNAVKDTETYEIDGEVLECSLAKPPSDKKSDTGSSNKKGGLLQSQPSRGGYGYPSPGFAQPMMYGRPPQAAMMPMILPDGRLAYVMQQPGVPPVAAPPRSVGRNSYSGGGRKSDDSGGRRYRPY